MGVGDGEEGWNSESGEDDGDCEGRDDYVELIETTSPITDNSKSIFHLSERNEDNTDWLFPDVSSTTADLPNPLLDFL
jgi:hypothetical protein